MLVVYIGLGAENSLVTIRTSSARELGFVLQSLRLRLLGEGWLGQARGVSRSIKAHMFL